MLTVRIKAIDFFEGGFQMAFLYTKQILLFLVFTVRPATEQGYSEAETPLEPVELPLEPDVRDYGRGYYSTKGLSLPPSHVDPIQSEPLLRRQYRLEDFLWTGSGDGPHPSEQDGGLAWEDNGGAMSSDSRAWIRVTKTMTLYRTVLTTIYPVEVTPTVMVSGEVTSSPVVTSPTPHLPVEISPSPQYPVDTDLLWLPTPTAPPEPTAYPVPPLPPTASPPTDPIYWIQTSIKSNNTVFQDNPDVFQVSMQKRLARVYASAFKRHLLSTLGILQKSGSRRRRDASTPPPPFQFLYLANPSMSPWQRKQLATTAMNITVAIVNISTPAPPQVDLRYVVLAEGSPVPGFSAVKELELVTKREMESELGYEIINRKAEALVAGPPEHIPRNSEYVATSPWLIVALTTIALLVVLLGVIGFMVWKWKHNRLGDLSTGQWAGERGRVGSPGQRRPPRPPRPQSGIITADEQAGSENDQDDAGVVNPAFATTPKRITRGENLDKSPKSSPASSLLSTRARTATKKLTDVIRMASGMKPEEDEPERRHRKHLWHSPSSSEDRKEIRSKPGSAVITSSEGSADWKELLGEVKPRAGGRKRSPVRGAGRGHERKKELKEVNRRKRKKSQFAEEANLKTDFEAEEEEEDDDEEDEVEAPLPTTGAKQQPWTKGAADAISLGNLDIFQEPVAQTPSEYAKRLVPWKRPGSAVAAQTSPPPGSTRGIQTIEEKDREISEHSESSPQAAAPIDTKDAGVQTPTRISKTAGYKQRASAKPRKSWKSPGGEAGDVISTESEEIVEVHHIGGGEENPLGRMRKRFHQFLDDAFNVMVSGRHTEEEEPGTSQPRTRRRGGETQSAKVSISHEVVETETEWRPWTSHVVREETLEKMRKGRPKSAAVPVPIIGPPKRAWTASSERRTHSAKCAPSHGTNQPHPEPLPDEDEEESYDTFSRHDPPRQSSTSVDPPSTSSIHLSPAFIFPSYPTYPDIRVTSGGGDPPSTSGSSTLSQQSHQPSAPSLPPNDPAVPLIQAIKQEMKKFEKEPPKST